MNHVNMISFAVFLALFVRFGDCASSPFQSVTDNLLKEQRGDVIAAYGDFDGNKLADIFVITANATEVDVLLSQVQSGSFDRSFNRKKLIVRDPTSNDTVITGVMLGDFNGDVQMDVLLTRRYIDKKENPEYTVHVYWGDASEMAVTQPPYIFKETFKDQPLLFDVNADMLPDLLAETSTGLRRVWVADVEKNFTLTHEPFQEQGNKPFSEYNSNAFLDLHGISGDSTADLLIALKPEEGFEVWSNQGGYLTYNHTYTISSNVTYKVVGQSAFIDFNQDGIIDHMLPVCEDEACRASKLYVYDGNTWHKVFDSFKDLNDTVWGFVPPNKGPYNSFTNFTFPITVRAGDYDQDGFSDIMVILQDGKGHQRGFLLNNAPCEEEFCKGYGRTFTVAWDTVLSQIEAVIQMSFFDLYEDGTLDPVIVSLTSYPGVSGIMKPVISLFRNDISGDTCFIKVLVASGLCSGNCAGGRKQYGTNQPGPTIKYKTTRTDGSTQHSTAGQLSQSAHFALHLPYTIFGLGQTPNFVDEMQVAIPHDPDTGPLQKAWPQIIPNSQLIVTPYPLKQPSSWSLKLFLTPSRMIYLTGAALVGTCGFVAGIVGILHWREKREDAVEKKQEAQKFHFDAM